jgi:hypothetical protein
LEEPGRGMQFDEVGEVGGCRDIEVVVNPGLQGVPDLGIGEGFAQDSAKIPPSSCGAPCAST